MALGVPLAVAEAVADPAPDDCATADAALDELELEPPHAASITALSRTSAAPTPRVPIIRPNPDITNLLLSRHSRSRADIVRPSPDQGITETRRSVSYSK